MKIKVVVIALVLAGIVFIVWGLKNWGFQITYKKHDKVDDSQGVTLLYRDPVKIEGTDHNRVVVFCPPGLEPVSWSALRPDLNKELGKGLYISCEKPDDVDSDASVKGSR